MIALISDIHGNFEALKEVLNKIDEMKISKIYCLGDVTGYYSQVNECCDELKKRNVECVMGNHDWYMASNSYCPRSKSANECINYQRKIITKDNKDWISSFPVIRNENNLNMVHGGWINPIDEYLEITDDYFDRIEGKFFVSGHCHKSTIKKCKDKIYCNPGSVGQPRDNDPRASFAIFDGQNFKILRVEYDIDKVGKLMEKVGFSGYYYGCLYTGNKNLCWRQNVSL